MLWPSDPKLNIVRIQLNHVRPHISPSPSLDISMAITIKVRNRDFFSLNYDSLVVSIGYRGRQLGFVNSNNGFLRSRASSYVNATLVLDGIQIIHDVFYLIEDLAKGEIPFDTVTQINGNLGLFFFDIPIKGKVSCEVYVNTANQTIMHQDCYPE
ncbi:Late embryogenesis abundant (LEA) hydroxyproline-rich glycoprotein family [Thalictrum thalictroides]|uniref:Late embryogenesis abundant (LEA) hydroxyproline-rich glycoprotein family n=1 Tax=Thalictrum thalictroides TaxID=46969 RepID=A0A7J6W2Q3_THATH|nr:Late embryogenesis abundant (LEA) hydroxyproline-rich glycoprotein family [Thalictrum thalictroides]